MEIPGKNGRKNTLKTVKDDPTKQYIRNLRNYYVPSVTLLHFHMKM